MPRVLQTEVELQKQCVQLEMLKITNFLLQKNLVGFRRKLDSYCELAKEKKKQWTNWYGAKRKNKAAAGRNAEQEKSNTLLEQNLANFKFNAA